MYIWRSWAVQFNNSQIKYSENCLRHFWKKIQQIWPIKPKNVLQESAWICNKINIPFTRINSALNNSSLQSNLTSSLTFCSTFNTLHNMAFFYRLNCWMDSPFLTRTTPQMPILPHNTFLYSSFPAELCTYRLSTVSKLTQKHKIMKLFFARKMLCSIHCVHNIQLSFNWKQPIFYARSFDCTMTLGSTQPLTETSTTEVPGSKGSWCVGLTTLPTFMCQLSRNSRSLTQLPRALRAYPGLYRNSCTFTFMFYASFWYSSHTDRVFNNQRLYTTKTVHT